jgi:hypothetical protein
MVVRCIHEIHTQTNQRIHFQCVPENAYYAAFQAHTNYCNKRLEKGIWRLCQLDARKLKVEWASSFADRNRERGDHTSAIWSKAQPLIALHCATLNLIVVLVGNPPKD